ncbi:MAG TPA: GGDEF domain-containing protein, partial [Gammaproteobacteria bacterium]|nr:GGDEF domain-containing protein [Gammaproteobacteria bacterium]
IQEEVVARVTNLITNKQLFDQVQAQQKHLYELAMTDQLTGLFNRNSLAEFASKYFSQAARHDFPLSVIIMDIDHFKQINDKHGHLSGDTVLEHIGSLLKSNCREEDFAARYGGEEFLLILTHCTLDCARDKADELRRDLEKLEPAGIPVTGSFGITARPANRKISLDDLLRAADTAVYEAKRQGRNQVVSVPADMVGTK